MKYTDEILAKKYAVAYINIFGSCITEKEYQALSGTEEMLLSYTQALFLMQVPMIKRSIKIKALHHLITTCAVGASFDTLLHLLFDQQRITLLPAVVRYIVKEYQIRTNRITCTLKSSHVLTEEQQDIVKSFFDGLVAKTVAYTYHVDSRLIAGIRLQSDTWLWEYSVNKQLRESKRQFAKGISWK
jgi:F0F1-type ATP synthase delta subunit